MSEISWGKGRGSSGLFKPGFWQLRQHFSLDLRMSKTTMRLSTSDRTALRAYLATEFNRWVEDLLSRDELPLVGSAVPAMKQPQPRRGTKTKTKAKAKAKAQMKTSREEDQLSAPAAPAPEDRRPAPVASTPEEDPPEDDWKTATARRNKRRRRSQDISKTEPQPGKRPRAATTTTKTSSTTSTKSRSRQCHNCQGYGHTTRSCANQAICAQCSGTHPSIDCVSKCQDGTPPRYYCDLCKEEGHGRRSRFCKNRPRPAPKAKPTPPPQDAEDTMDVSPATSDAATQADIPLFTDLQAF